MLKNLIPVCVCSLVVILVLDHFREPTPVTPAPPPVIESPDPAEEEPIDIAAIRREAAMRIRPTLRWAELQAQSEIGEHLKLIDEVFARANAGAKPFAEEALGYSSKWRFVADYVPFTSGKRHQVYMKNCFRRHIMKQENLAKSIQGCLTQYQRSMKSIENKMLVKMRADVADLPQIALPEFSSKEKLAKYYDGAVRSSLGKAEQLAAAGIGAEVASMVAGEVLGAVATRLGVSSGILSAGAASGYATFGVGVVAGVIVDQMVSLVWDWWADPTANIQKTIQKELSKVRKLIIYGDAKTRGLKSRMSEMARERSRIREVAVSSLLVEG